MQAPTPAKPAAPVVSAPPTNTAAHARRTQRTLLSADTFTPPATSKPVKSVPSSAAPPPPTAQNDLFTLDFTPPTTTQTPSTTTNAPNKAAKNDILSLYNSAAAAVPAVAPHAAGSAVPPNSFMGTNGTGLWGVSSGWAPSAPAAGADPWASLDAAAAAAPTTSMASPPAYGSGFGAAAQQPFAAAPSANVWGAPATPNAHQNATTFDATGVWGAGAGAAKPMTPTTTPTAFDLFATTGSAANGNAGAGNAPKKDDAFGDLWAGFK